MHEGAAALVLVAGLPQGADLHLVDRFGEPTQWWEPADEQAVKAVVSRAARRRGGPRLHWHVAPSRDVASGWSLPVDLVLIDGERAREACRLDWDLWSPHVRSGGVVAFHGARGGDPGPTAVVTELFGAGDPPGWRILARARHDRGGRAAGLTSALLYPWHNRRMAESTRTPLSMGEPSRERHRRAASGRAQGGAPPPPARGRARAAAHRLGALGAHRGRSWTGRSTTSSTATGSGPRWRGSRTCRRAEARCWCRTMRARCRPTPR